MSHVRISASACLLASFSLDLALSTPALRAQPVAEEKKYAQEFYVDFRGKPLPEELTLLGKEAPRFVQPGSQGLRITLPAVRESAAPIGVGTLFRVQGDFEITAALEVLHADVPEKGFGVGATLTINKVDPPTEGTNIGRLMRPQGDKIMWDRRYDKPGEKPTFAGNAQPCTDKIVRLRLQRTGTQLAYLWAVGASGGEFKKLNQNHFGSDDVQQVMLRARTEGPYNVDVNLLDLRVRSDGMGQANAGARGPGTRTGLVAALLIILAIAICLAVALGLRRRRAAAAEGRTEAGTGRSD